MSFGFGLGIAVFVIAIVGDSVAAWKVEGEGIRVVQEFGHPFQLQNIKFITLPNPKISIEMLILRRL